MASDRGWVLILGGIALVSLTFSAPAAATAVGDSDLPILRALVEHLKASEKPEVVVIDRELVLDHDSPCESNGGANLLQQLPGLEAAALESFCRLEPGAKLSREQAKSLGGHTPLLAGFKTQRVELRISFSPVVFNADRTKALVYATHKLQGDYFLLAQKDGAWTVVATAMSWIS